MKKSILIVLLFSSSFLYSQIIIGTASDAMSALTIHPMLDCNPLLNMISFVYASTALSNPSKLYVNYSTNGGDTWLNSGSLLFNNTSLTSVPQFPGLLIYNPAGNSIADSAYLHWLSPIGNSGNYQAFRFGSTHPAILPSTNINTLSLPGSNIPADGIITQQGETYFLFPPVASGSLSIADSFFILHGTWDNTTSNMIYTSTTLAAPLNLDSNNVFRYRTGGIAFANDGLTGYIYLMAHHEFDINNDSTYYPIIYKTTDAGLTWSTPVVVNLNNCDVLLMTSVTGKYSAGYEVDGTVDANNNLHLVMAVVPLLANNKLDVQGGRWGLFDIYSTNGGTAWNAELLKKPQTNNVLYPGNISTYSRAQVARNWSGDHLFFGWFDTDTLTFVTTFNTHPELFVKAFDVNSQQWTTTVNKTSATSASAQCLFGMIAPYVLESGTQYELPVSIALNSAGPAQLADYRYLNNLLIDSTTFTHAGNPVILNSSLVGINSVVNSASGYTVYPNPLINELTVKAPNTQPSEIILYDVTARKLLQKEFTNSVTLNTDLLSNGIYIYEIHNNNHTVKIGKLVKE